MTDRVLELVKELYPNWGTAARWAALGRQLGHFDDDELIAAIQDDYDNPERQFGFDPRRIAEIVRARRKEQRDREWERLTPRQQFARVLRRDWHKRYPHTRDWDDDRLLREYDIAHGRRRYEVYGKHEPYWSEDQRCFVRYDPDAGCARPVGKRRVRPDMANMAPVGQIVEADHG